VVTPVVTSVVPVKWARPTVGMNCPPLCRNAGAARPAAAHLLYAGGVFPAHWLTYQL